MKPISTKVHGMIDYASAGTLLVLPRVLKWDKTVTNLLTGAGVATALYSVLTRYELGVVKRLPMKAHLAMDGASGAMLAASPLLLPEEGPAVVGTLVGFGAFEVAASLMTKTQPADPSLAA
jgi:hypothetical protein